MASPKSAASEICVPVPLVNNIETNAISENYVNISTNHDLARQHSASLSYMYLGVAYCLKLYTYPTYTQYTCNWQCYFLVSQQIWCLCIPQIHNRAIVLLCCYHTVDLPLASSTPSASVSPTFSALAAHVASSVSPPSS